METIYTIIARFYAGMYERDDSKDVGAGLVEYALLVALISIASITVMIALGTNIGDVFQDVVDALPG